MPQKLVVACAFLSCAYANLASSWPAEPLSKDGAPQYTYSHATTRALQETAGPEGVGMYHIIMWSSIAIAASVFFAVIALFNMDVGNDSLLFSKAKQSVPRMIGFPY